MNILYLFMSRVGYESYLIKRRGAKLDSISKIEETIMMTFQILSLLKYFLKEAIAYFT